MNKNVINSSKTYLGIELGSTRIKAVLIDDSYFPIANGSYEWENSMENGYWTYSLENIHNGIKECYKSLKENVKTKYRVSLTNIGAIGISAMMHGYLAFDKNNNLLVPFRTWRNTTTKEASEKLTKIFEYNIPQRWSISHLYQAILNNESHTAEISYITTLSGYIHFLLTGKHEIGIGDASGMFPINNGNYDTSMLESFQELINDKNYTWKIKDILPIVKKAGDNSTLLSEEGAKFLDPSGELTAGIPLCPPEGDAGTGMVATNSVLPKTGNISAGTSIFAMLVLEKQLSKYYPQIDIVTTPDGLPVAMVHCNNCCNELDTWVNMFYEFASMNNFDIDKSKIYNLLYNNALNGDCDGIITYNYLSGEHVTEISNGHPMYFRQTNSKMNLANFFKSQLFSTFATLMLGLKTLYEKENVISEKYFAHGGLFKTPKVAQQILSSALKTPVSVMDTAGEGGAWGIALLSAYMINKGNLSLGDWLNENVFTNCAVNTLSPIPQQTKEFNEYLEQYEKGLAAQKSIQ